MASSSSFVLAAGLLLLLRPLVPTASAYSPEQAYCTDLRPQNGLDMSQIMGMWYGVEIVSHLRADDDVNVFETCPVLHLAEISYEMTSTETNIRPGSYGYQWTADRFSQYTYRDREFRHLRLYWDEYGNQLEFYLKFNNTRKGFWISSGPQHGSKVGLLLQKQYNQFSGTVQVMKAVVDHLVLTFCYRLPETKLFTIILSRQPQQLSRQEVHGIHNMLSRRDLSVSSVRKVCSGCTVERGSLIGLVAFTIVSIIVHIKPNVL